MLKKASEYFKDIRETEDKNYERLCTMVSEAIERAIYSKGYRAHINVYDANDFIWTKDDSVKQYPPVDLYYFNGISNHYEFTNVGKRLLKELKDLGYTVYCHPKQGLTIMVIENLEKTGEKMTYNL